jgi:serine/threonine protein phosphatase PrpC
MRVECYAKSLSHQGRTANEDAFIIIREPIPVAAVCDGAGNAEQAARKVVRQLERFVRQATGPQFLEAATWAEWARKLDSFLLGGNESTLLAVGVAGDQLCGVSAGDSQAYLLRADGGLEYLTTSTQKARLGSGEVRPFTFGAILQPRDVVLLMTDGAWTPLSPFLIGRAVRSVILEHFAEVPSAVLNAASRTGRWDDMTVVALRLVGR